VRNTPARYLLLALLRYVLGLSNYNIVIFLLAVYGFTRFFESLLAMSNVNVKCQFM